MRERPDGRDPMPDDAPTPHFDPEPHLARLHADGYTVIPDFLDAAGRQAVRDTLAPLMGRRHGRNNFEGEKTERVYTLVARGGPFAGLAAEPRVLALCDRLLQPGYLLSASQAICIHPGETPQPVHTDDSFYRVPRPRQAIGVAIIAAIDAFTEDNGATEVIPGSHRWDDAQVQDLYDGIRHDAPMPESVTSQLVPVTMPAGACVFFLGTLVHRGGPNRSAAPRLAITNQYCEPWARPQENFFHGVPLERARAMPERVQELLGYSIWPPFMGQVTAAHPKKVLAEGYVNRVEAEDAAARGD